MRNDPIVGYRQHLHKTEPNSVLAQMLTIKEAMKLKGITHEQVRYRIRTGELPVYRNLPGGRGRSHLIKPADLERVFPQ